jgi:hypothetical protein
MEFLAVVINVKHRWLRIPLKIKLLSVLIITKQWLLRIYHMTQIYLHMQSPDYSFAGMKFGKQKEGC